MKKKNYQAFLALFIFCLSAILYSWPTIIHLSDSLVGDGWDAALFAWDLWWMNKAVMELHTNPFNCPEILNPVGCNLLFHTFVPLYGLLSIPLQLFVTHVESYNIIVLLTHVLTGWSMYLLGRTLGLGFFASLVSGIAFAYCPVRMIRTLGHLNLLSTQWLALFFVFFLKARETRQWSPRFMAVFIIICSFFTSYQMTIVLGILWLFLVFYPSGKNSFVTPDNTPAASHDKKSLSPLILQSSSNTARNNMTIMVSIAVISLILLTPFWIMLYHEIDEHGLYGSSSSGYERYRSDLIYYVMPLQGSIPGSFLHKKFGTTRWLGTEKVLSPGVIPLVLWIFGCFLIRRISLRKEFIFISIFTLSYFILSLGSHLLIAGWETGIDLPYQVFLKIPLLNNLSVPNRFALGTAFGLALLAGICVQNLVTSKSRWGRLSGYSVLFLVVFETFTAPVDIQPIPKNSIQHEDGWGNRFQIPFGLDGSLERVGFNISRLYLLNQTYHNQVMTSGHVSRLPGETVDYFKRNLVYQIIGDLQAGKSIDFEGREETIRNSVRDWAFLNRISTITVNRSYLEAHAFRNSISFLKKFLPEHTVTVSDSTWLFSLEKPDYARYKITFGTLEKDIYIRGYSERDDSESLNRAFKKIDLLMPMERSENLQLNMRVGLDGISPSEEVSLKLRINGCPVSSGLVSESAANLSFDIPAGFLKRGVNRVTLELDEYRLEHLADDFLNVSIQAVSTGYNYNNNGGYSRITVDGVNVSRNLRGLNVVTIDPESGKLLWSRNYDTCGDENSSDRLLADIEELPDRTLVAVSVKDDASVLFSSTTAEALEYVGGTENLRGKFRSAYSLIGFVGAEPGETLEKISPNAASLSSAGPALCLYSLEVTTKR